MSTELEAQDGATLAFQRNETSPQPLYQVPPYQVNEKQFENWQYRWNSKEEVIDHLLSELERSMVQSSSKEGVTLNIVSQNHETG